jgi:hypothetical protein
MSKPVMVELGLQLVWGGTVYTVLMVGTETYAGARKIILHATETEAIEDAIDLEEADTALKDYEQHGGKRLDTLITELGLEDEMPTKTKRKGKSSKKKQK